MKRTMQMISILRLANTSPALASAYIAIRSGSPVAFCDSALWRCEAKTPTLIRFLAQLNVKMNRSSVEGAIVFSRSVEATGLKLARRPIFVNPSRNLGLSEGWKVFRCRHPPLGKLVAEDRLGWCSW